MGIALAKAKGSTRSSSWNCKVENVVGQTVATIHAAESMKMELVEKGVQL